jgi:hypothetical protein
MVRAALGFATVILVGCSAITGAIAHPTAVTAISGDEAIGLGLQAAQTGGLEIRMLRVDPETAQADLTTLAEAMKRLTGSETVARGERAETLVWTVTVEGQWQDVFPRTTEMPTPETLGLFFVVIDANTGGSYLLGARP